MTQHAQPSISEDTPSASLSVLVLISSWPLEEAYQAQLKTLAQNAVVQELILVGEYVQELPLLLAGEAKLRSYTLNSGSLSLMAEAAAFEAGAEVLVILEQNVILPPKTLQTIPATIAEGCQFGGLIQGRSRWWRGLLRGATVYCKCLLWFRLIQGYFVSRTIYHHSGGFKQDGRLITFSQLLCKQKKLSRYTFLFF